MQMGDTNTNLSSMLLTKQHIDMQMIW